MQLCTRGTDPTVNWSTRPWIIEAATVGLERSKASKDHSFGAKQRLIDRLPCQGFAAVQSLLMTIDQLP
jgi:hypothetical protein